MPKVTRRTRPDVLIESVSSHTHTRAHHGRDAHLNTRTSFKPDDFDFATPWISLKRPCFHPRPASAFILYRTTESFDSVLVPLPTLRLSFFFTTVQIRVPASEFPAHQALCHRGLGPAIPATVDSLCIWYRRQGFFSQSRNPGCRRYSTEATCKGSHTRDVP